MTDAVISALAKTVGGSQDDIKQGTQYLQSQAKDPQFASTLFSVINSDQPVHVRQAGAIYFKNYLRDYWPINENQEYQIPPNVCIAIKREILSLLLNAPESVQKQIVDCIEMISLTDFPKEWPDILPELVRITGSAFQEKNYKKVIDCLKATNSLLHQYRTASNTENVNIELAFILKHLSGPLRDEFKLCADLLQSQKDNPGALKIIFHILHQLYKTFYCLNYVDLPEFMQDNIEYFIGQHLVHLSFENNSDELMGDDDDKPGILLKVQANILQNITIYVQKYEEEFEPFIKKSIEICWNKLTKVDHSLAKFDNLLARGMMLLTSVSTGVAHTILANPNTLKLVCENIIIPNLMFREDDEINFEEDPLEYIRIDLEESNLCTRRASACELVKGLRRHHESEVTQIFASYVMQLLQEYSKDKKNGWKKKDVSFFLITALTVSGSTRAQGVTNVNALVPLTEFLKDQVVCEFTDFPNNHPVIQADALKYVITFRNQIDKQYYDPIIRCALKMLTSEHVVVATYAASCIERLLVVKDGNTPRFTAADLKPFTNDILTAAFSRLSQDAFQNNEYIMRLVMRVLAVSKGDVTEKANAIMQELQKIIDRISKNPTIPAFDHYVFESVACLCTCLHSKNADLVSEFESRILPTMSIILQSDIANFSPYVYQLLAMFLELTPNRPFTDSHKELLTHIMAPATWSNTGNIPALTRLVQAYLRKDINSLIKDNQLNQILGIFQKLIGSSLQDHHGIAILNVVIEVVPWDNIKDVIQSIFTVIFTRLSSKKTTKLCCEFTLFLGRFVHKYSLSILQQVVEKISPGIMNNVLGVWSSSLDSYGKQSDIQIASIMSSSILCDPLMTQAPLVNHWPPIAIGLAKLILIEKRGPDMAIEDDIFAEQKDNQLRGLQTSFVKLAHSTTTVTVDQFLVEVSKINRKEFVVNQLRKFIATDAQRMNPLLQEVSKDPKGAEFVKLLV